ncbi:MAG TPA: Crp/Fnr family transcriptional regulator [Verrucomicrobiota bacterium]|nr:Crp/Fnr family transcriptional regulator [Verrucomicrobiota bacterium]
MPNPLSDLRLAALMSTLRSCQLFAGLRTEDLQAVANLVTVRTLTKGEYLFHEGEPATGFYLVQKGAINVHRVNAAGKEQVIHVFRAGETFAEAALATERGYPADARAVEASQVLQIQKSGFVDLLKRHPEIALRILGSMSAHLRVVVSQLEDLTLKDVETRLANWLIKRCPAGESGPVTIELRGTKRTLAAELGTVSETFSRSLAKLRGQHLLEVKGNTFIVPAPGRLRELLHRNLGD